MQYLKMNGGDIMWTIDELADFFKVDYTTIYSKVISKKIKAVKAGVQWRITDEEVERLKREGF